MSKRLIARALTIVALSGSLTVVAQTPVLANVCNHDKTKTIYNTTVYVGPSNPLPPGQCFRVQARIDRYYNSTVDSCYGPQSGDQSTVTCTHGVHAGNLYRLKPTSLSSDPWTHWATF